MTNLKNLFAALLVVAWASSVGEVNAQPGTGPASVAAGKVIEVRWAGTETFVGTLKPIRKSIVGSAVEGRVVSMDVDPGDPVGAESESNETASNEIGRTFLGQRVTQLRTGTLEIEIGAAEIQLKLAQRSVEELEASLPKEIELAAANTAEAAARLQYSSNNYQRSFRLGAGAISKGELEQARSQFQADEEAAKAARISLERLNATREIRLVQTGLRVEAAQQELVRLHDLKKKYTIRAPFQGLVTQKLTDIGEWVTKGQPIVEVVQIDPIEMIIDVPQKHLSRLKQSLGSASETSPLVTNIEIDGYEQPLEGIVKRIVAQADLRSRTFPVRIEIKNPADNSGYLLQPGMIGRASLMIGVEQDMLMVKKDALVLGSSVTKVFKIVEADGMTTAVAVPVAVGASRGEWIQVSGDLNPDDRIVLLGNERLRPGQAIKVTQTIDEVPE